MNYKIRINKLKLYYGDTPALKKISFGVPANGILALIGPSGCGKSTCLRAINRMNDLIDGVRLEGEVLLDGTNIYHPYTDVVMLRKRVGMVFQRPNPFPMSIYDNVAYGPRIHGLKKKSVLNEIVEKSLSDAEIGRAHV